ncbi:MAG: hypothetical protein ACFE8G_08220 [Candidatus Hermodarchaeota archaeon]
MSSKVVSYFDWTLGFKSNSSESIPKIKNAKKGNLNSIGMTEDEFKRHVNKWKNKNL